MTNLEHLKQNLTQMLYTKIEQLKTVDAANYVEITHELYEMGIDGYDACPSGTCEKYDADGDQFPTSEECEKCSIAWLNAEYVGGSERC